MLEGNANLRSASSINQAPALPQKDLLIDQILDATPGTELEYIRIAGLCAKFAQYSIPTDVSTITLQEVVNVVDECYDVIRVDRPFTVAQIEKMCGL